MEGLAVVMVDRILRMERFLSVASRAQRRRQAGPGALAISLALAAAARLSACGQKGGLSLPKAAAEAASAAASPASAAQR
jgi:predicted small lipoprotein YifL